ncbi:MAG: L-fucokinase, partial [Candidatus Desantisbacteria bacterium]
KGAVIQSAGESKRIPNLSSTGKAWAYLPMENPRHRETNTIFDEVRISLSSVAYQIEEGLVVINGDNYFVFDYDDIDFKSEGVVIVGWRAPAELAVEKHGILVSDRKGLIKYSLEKPSMKELEELGIIPRDKDADRSVNISTGLMTMGKKGLAQFARLAGLEVKDGKLYDNGGITKQAIDAGLEIDLYFDILPAMATGSNREEFINRPKKGLSKQEMAKLRSIRERIWDTLHEGVSYHLAVTTPFVFIDIGTAEGYYNLFTGSTPRTKSYGKVLGFKKVINSIIEESVNIGANQVYDSILKGKTSLGKDNLIFNCDLNGTKVGNRNKLTGIYDPLGELEVTNDKNIYSVPIIIAKGLKKRTTVIIGLGDNPKIDKLFGEDITTWARKRGITPDELWQGLSPKEEKTLWTAKLFIAHDREFPDFSYVNWIQREGPPPSSWREANKLSMNDISKLTDKDTVVQEKIDLSEARLRRDFKGRLSSKWEAELWQRDGAVAFDPREAEIYNVDEFIIRLDPRRQGGPEKARLEVTRPQVLLPLNKDRFNYEWVEGEMFRLSLGTPRQEKRFLAARYPIARYHFLIAATTLRHQLLSRRHIGRIQDL